MSLATGPIGLVIATLGLLYAAWQTNFLGIRDIVTSAIEFVSDNIDDWVEWIFTLPDRLFEAGANMFKAMWDGLKSVWADLTKWIEDKVEWLLDKLTFWDNTKRELGSSSVPVQRGGSVKGSYASGLSYVPRDMDVRVHEGERILTKEENRNYPNRSGFPEKINLSVSIPLDGEVIAHKQYSLNMREGTLQGDSLIEGGL